MGSVARKVVQYSRRPVVLLRPAQTDRPLTLRERLAQLEPEVHQQKRIVLALDGTLEAELGLKPVIELARAIDATVLLLKVVVPVLPAQFAGSYSMIDSSIEIDLEQDQALAYDYLEAIQQKVIDQGVRCVCAVRLALPMSNPALEIVDYAFNAKAMLVAMATHTKGSLSRMIFGSISDEVLRQSETPVLFIHTDYSTKAEFVISSEKAGFDEYERIG
jgi:nucleotide-binding universal stress UspA family protein